MPRPVYIIINPMVFHSQQPFLCHTMYWLTLHVAATIGLRDTDDEGTTVLWNAGTYLFNDSGNILEDLRPATTQWGPQISQCLAKGYTADSIYIQCNFLGQSAASRCEGLSTFREWPRPLLKGVLVLWYNPNALSGYPKPLCISPFGRAWDWMRMNSVTAKASVPTLIWPTSSNIFVLEEGWRIFPGALVQTVNDFRRSILTYGKPECSITFPFIPVTSQRPGAGVW